MRGRRPADACHVSLGVVLRKGVVLRDRVVLGPQPRVRGGREREEEDKTYAQYPREDEELGAAPQLLGWHLPGDDAYEQLREQRGDRDRQESVA